MFNQIEMNGSTTNTASSKKEEEINFKRFPFSWLDAALFGTAMLSVLGSLFWQ
jgi:hypothetical protein